MNSRLKCIQLLLLLILKKSVLAYTDYTSLSLFFQSVNSYEQPTSSSFYIDNGLTKTNPALQILQKVPPVNANDQPTYSSSYTDNGLTKTNPVSPFQKTIEDNLSDIYTYDPPLFLTPYIESGEIEQGRTLSRVTPLPNAPYVPSYSGFITVNKEYNSNIFFWFFPALNNDSKAPVILWLQGGPGAPGLFGLFLEIGPYILYSNTTAGLRQHPWTREFNVIFVDNPVGSGFSFTDNEKGYATVEDQVADDLYSFLGQFFKIYQEYGDNDLYIAGESYGGKHAPYLGYKILHDPAEFNLKGIAVGNGFIDFYLYRGTAKHLYELGLVDCNQAAIIESYYNSANQHLKNGEYLLAMEEFNKLFGAFKVPVMTEPSYFTNVSGYTYFYNFLQTKEPEDYKYYSTYVQSPQSRNAIHVGNLKFHGEDIVQRYLNADILGSSSRDKLSYLMDNTRVLVYNGQLDLACPYVAMEDFLRNLTWKYSNEYKAADRKIWNLGNHVAGYVRSVRNFTLAEVRNAGHLVPHDQPEAALDLIIRFIKNLTFS